MAEETITILKIGTEDAITSVGALKQNIKELKKELESTQIDTEEGWKKYQATLVDLTQKQNLLKDAMYATTGSLQDLDKAASGTAETYNSLVHQMASLKSELRNVDVSTDAGKKKFAELAGQVDEVNNKLKAMDALQGNFQRNVGNYQTAFKGLGEKVDGFAKGLTAVKGGLNGAKGAFDAMAKTPALVVLGILASTVSSLVSHFKESEEGAKKLEAGMVNMEPALNLVRGIMAKLSDIIGKVVTNVSEFLGSNGLINKIINGVIGVGNAIVQFVIAPFKAVAAAIKTFKEQGIKGIGDAAKAFEKELNSGIAFKKNFNAGQGIADALIAGAKSKKKKVKAAGQELGKDLLDGIDEISSQLDKQLDTDIAAMLKADEKATQDAQRLAQQRLDGLEKVTARQLELNDILVEDDDERAKRAYEIEAVSNQKRLQLLDKLKAEAMDRGDVDAYLAFEQERADLDVEIETNAVREKERLRRKDLEDAEAKAKAQQKLLMTAASATSSILGSIADAYEAEGDQSEEAANRTKALRIAAATIDTISGAIGAFMQATETIPPPFGQIVGGIEAAAITAAGAANIAKMQATKVGSSSGSSGSVSFPSFPTAPATTPNIPQVRNVTGASEEQRLNNAAQPQEVYILQSSIEAAGLASQVQVAESSF